MEKVVRYGKGYARTLRRKCGIRHDIALKRFYISDPRNFDSHRRHLAGVIRASGSRAMPSLSTPAGSPASLNFTCAIPMRE